MATVRENDEILTHLQRIDDYEFEHFIADLWARQGWDTEVSQASVDAGIDVVATKEIPYPQKMLIQAKRYGPNTTVGGPDIQQYASLKYQQDSVDSVIVVTSNRFSSHAHDRARELNVKTVDGTGLVELLERLNSYDLLDKYSASGTAPNTIEESQPVGKSTDDSSFWADISPDTYFRFIQAGTAIWTIGFLLAQVGYSGGGGTLDGIFGLAAIICWVLFPPSLYYEAKRVAEDTDWSPHGTLYAVASVIPFLNALMGGIYLFRRRKAYQRAESVIEELGESNGVGAESSEAKSPNSLTNQFK